MKIRNIFTGLLITAGIIVPISLLHAQQTATPVQGGAISLATLANEDVSGLTDFEVELKALELLPTTPASQLPDFSHGFYSVQHPEWPPLPADTSHVAAWNMGEGFFALDDRLVNYNALAKTKKIKNSSGGGVHAMDVPGAPGDGGDDGGSDDFEPSFVPPSTNDLWLQMITVTNDTAAMVIHPPWNVTNGVYDLWYCTNLSPTINWQWLLRTDAGQTNLIVPNAADAQGFYQIRPPNDLAATGSEGTDFWVAFCSLYDYYNTNVLSLYISSQVGATVTVGVFTNGPILVVTNCGDTSVNGTYVLTNLTGQVLEVWTNYEGNSGLTNGYVKGADWVIYDGGYGGWYVFEYDSGTVLTPLYFKLDLNLNGSSSDWQLYDDPNPGSTPTTICPQTSVSQESFTVAAGAVTNISIPFALMITNYDIIGTRGIHITASQPVSVYGMDYYGQGSAAFTAYPTPLLGTNYCIMSYAAPEFDWPSELAIVATADDTTVWITPSVTADLSNGSNSTYSVYLQQGQTYQIGSANYGDDVTGNKGDFGQAHRCVRGCIPGRGAYRFPR